MATQTSWSAFEGEKLLATGPAPTVAAVVRAAIAHKSGRNILIFDESSGRVVDLDLSGSDEEVLGRVRDREAVSVDAPRPPGRPKLGVVAREVTLLPRHWEWLSGQPGGASAALRRLVDAARAANAGKDRIRHAQEAADRFMSAMLGNQAGYEEASRALYGGEKSRFAELTEPWPCDLRDCARRMAAPAFEAAA